MSSDSDINDLFYKIRSSISKSPLTENAKENAEAEADKIKNERNRLSNKELADNLEARKTYALGAFCLVSVWLIIILLIVIFQGMHYIPFWKSYFNLSDTILVTLITTTTVNVTIYFTLVIRYLFPTSDNSQKDRE